MQADASADREAGRATTGPTPGPLIDRKEGLAAIGARWVVTPGDGEYTSLTLAGDFLAWVDRDLRICRVARRGGAAPVCTGPTSFYESFAADTTHAYFVESYGGCPKDDPPDSPRCREFGYRVMRVALAGHEPPQLVVPRIVKTVVEGLALDDTHAYWIEGSGAGEPTGKIRRVPKKGGVPQVVASGLPYGSSQLHVRGEDVLFVLGSQAAGDRATLAQVPRAGGKVTTWAAPEPVHSFEVDDAGVVAATKSAAGFAHWRMQQGAEPVRLWSVSLEEGGGNFALDKDAIYVHRCTTSGCAIVRVPRAGGPATELFSGRFRTSPDGVDARWVYFMGWERGPNSTEHVLRVPKAGGPTEELLQAPNGNVTRHVVRVMTDGDARFYVDLLGGIARAE